MRFALLALVACVAVAPPPTISHVAVPRVAPRSPPIDERLRALAVTDADFYRPVLYSWTTPASIATVRATHRALVATASTGTFVSPFNRALARLAAHGDRVARIFTTQLVHRRYAWPAPFATVLGLGPRSYGNALIRLELRPDAWIGRFDPDAEVPFAFVDAANGAVAIDDALAHPERIAAVFHVRTGRDVDPKFREYIVCNEAMVTWSIGTPEIRAELVAERALLVALHAQLSSSIANSWRVTLAFFSARYRLTAGNLDAIVDALDAYDATPE